MTQCIKTASFPILGSARESISAGWLCGLEHYCTTQLTIASQSAHIPSWLILTIQIFHKTFPNVKPTTTMIHFIKNLPCVSFRPFMYHGHRRNLNLCIYPPLITCNSSSSTHKNPNPPQQRVVRPILTTNSLRKSLSSVTLNLYQSTKVCTTVFGPTPKEFHLEPFCVQDLKKTRLPSFRELLRYAVQEEMFSVF